MFPLTIIDSISPYIRMLHSVNYFTKLNLLFIIWNQRWLYPSAHLFPTFCQIFTESSNIARLQNNWCQWFNIDGPENIKELGISFQSHIRRMMLYENMYEYCETLFTRQTRYLWGIHTDMKSSNAHRCGWNNGEAKTLFHFNFTKFPKTTARKYLNTVECQLTLLSAKKTKDAFYLISTPL